MTQTPINVPTKTNVKRSDIMKTIEIHFGTACKNSMYIQNIINSCYSETFEGTYIIIILHSNNLKSIVHLFHFSTIIYHQLEAFQIRNKNLHHSPILGSNTKFLFTSLHG